MIVKQCSVHTDMCRKKSVSLPEIQTAGIHIHWGVAVCTRAEAPACNLRKRSKGENVSCSA